jgi:hypothetical protein
MAMYGTDMLFVEKAAARRRVLEHGDVRDRMLFVENDFWRYCIGSTTDGLKKDPDGLLTIRHPRSVPADVSNWRLLLCLRASIRGQRVRRPATGVKSSVPLSCRPTSGGRRQNVLRWEPEGFQLPSAGMFTS